MNTCQSCQSEIAGPSHTKKKIVFCQKCQKKEFLAQPPPIGVVLQEEKDVLTIFYGMSRGRTLWVVGIALLLLVSSFLFWRANGFGAAASITTALALILLVFGVLFPSTTKITIRHHAVEVYQKFLRKREIVRLESIRQVYCVAEDRGMDGGPFWVYRVEAILKSGETVPLMLDVLHLKMAQYIEAKIESFLQIQDESVPGEVKS
jgi:hypothetical protein